MRRPSKRSTSSPATTRDVKAKMGLPDGSKFRCARCGYYAPFGEPDGTKLCHAHWQETAYAQGLIVARMRRMMEE